MTCQEIQEQIERLHEAAIEINRTPEMPLRFLIRALGLPEGSKVIIKRKSKSEREWLAIS